MTQSKKSKNRHAPRPTPTAPFCSSNPFAANSFIIYDFIIIFILFETKQLPFIYLFVLILCGNQLTCEQLHVTTCVQFRTFASTHLLIFLSWLSVMLCAPCSRRSRRT